MTTTCAGFVMALACVGAPAMQPQPEQPLEAPAEQGALAARPQVAASLELEADAAFRLGEQLRCPVCQGMPIAESPSTMAQDMMTRVREMLAAGKTEREVLDYFVASYGEWVLLKPRAQGFNALVWLLPPLGLVFGVFLFLRWLRRSAARAQEGDRAREPAVVAPTAGQSEASPPSSRDADLDPYVAAIRKEVQR